MTQTRPCIGVFDSGFGGLTVLREMIRLVPDADYHYFGDTARLPYGSKSAETVSRYAVGAAHFLEQHGAEMLVIACNTASALALDSIRAGVHVPVVGVVEPGADRGADASRDKKVIVVATEATVSSHAYLKALQCRGIEAKEKACPLLVPLVEEGWIDHKITEEVARIYLEEAFSDGFQRADVLVLGCTHYPLIKPLLQRVVPQHVAIVDSAESTAAVVAQKLRVSEPGKEGKPGLQFFATDSVEKFQRLGARFLGQPIEKVQLVKLSE
ncbi:MAG TPA: glutamate racemase [Terriglobales bacterium]|nr:glutamate racemase [Terriglobales bacterium]